MSLLSQWQSDALLLEQALTASDISTIFVDNEADRLEKLFMNKNQWRCLRYDTGTSGYTPYQSSFAQYPHPQAIQYRSHDTSQNWAWGDRYLGVRECYVYCTSANTLSTTFWTDDAGNLYLNGSSRATSESCKSKSVTLPFKQGLNHVEIFFCEGGGGDAGFLNTDLASLSYVKWMYACYKM